MLASRNAHHLGGPFFFRERKEDLHASHLLFHSSKVVVRVARERSDKRWAHDARTANQKTGCADGGEHEGREIAFFSEKA